MSTQQRLLLGSGVQSARSTPGGGEAASTMTGAAVAPPSLTVRPWAESIDRVDSIDRAEVRRSLVACLGPVCSRRGRGGCGRGRRGQLEGGCPAQQARQRRHSKLGSA